MIWLAAALAVAIGCLIVAWRFFRKLEEGAPQASGDWCCVCLRDLDVGEVYEVRQHLEATGDELPGGGSWVASTYCPEHAPADAIEA